MNNYCGTNSSLNIVEYINLQKEKIAICRFQDTVKLFFYNKFRPNYILYFKTLIPGLIAGASVLTVCELIDYIVLRCSNRCGRNKKTEVSEFGSKAQLSPNNMVERGPEHYSTTHK